MLRFVTSILILFCSVALGVESPQVLDADWKIELISSEPALVTPTGCCFDDQGRLLVIECHTHFPPEDYAGPKIDRIYRFDDSDGDGVVDRKNLFYEGGVASMNITNLGDGSFAVATRSQVVRLRDTDDDGVAESVDVLLTHKTSAVYPHNGLGGLMMAGDGWLYVGQGENFGEPYEIVGTDGAKQIGGGEGGNVYRCKPDGSQLERVATGFWNPFGITMDPAGRLFVVGNDPDAMPPNRLMQVVRGGDYGFQFRFGRAGIHPLQCWNGELPGTLPMVTGTGEAVCAVAVRGGNLWATSWGDNRIERYTLEPRGASWTSKTEVVVQGDANFRPVGMSVAPDGSIYLTDWVDRSYSVHSKGRIWRLSSTGPPTGSMPTLTSDERAAARLEDGEDVSVDEHLIALESNDPFVRQAAMMGVIDFNQLASIDLLSITSPPQIVGLLSAWRWKELSNPESVSESQRNRWLDKFLQSDSDDVVLTALRWATERSCKEELPKITALLDRDDLSPRVFSAVIASIAYLETGSASGSRRDPAMEQRLIEFASNPARSARLRALALRRIPVESDQPSDQQMRQWLTEQADPALALEVVRLLTARASDSAKKQLAAIVSSERIDVQSRADALAGLSRDRERNAALIQRFAEQTESPVLQSEAKRSLQATLKPDAGSTPKPDDLDAWEKRVAGKGSVDAGRRVFIRRGCITCHSHSGRGANTGPDLTTLSGQMTPRRVLESILQPSKEVGPLYVPWSVMTTDGKVMTGLKLDAPGVGNSMRFQGADGNVFEIALEDIELQKPIETSIMPTGLQSTMTPDELRDLIAFLTAS